MTVQDQVAAARARLVLAGVNEDEAGFDAELLARTLLGWDRATYFSRRTEPAPAGFNASFDALVARRERREPVSQILGTREFWGRDFEVSSEVLTPRPETETLVEDALAWCKEHAPQLVVDVGTGSGCLAITLALELQPVRILAVDLSRAALRLARRNAARHGVASRITFIQSSLLSSLSGCVHLAIANLPYVPEPDADLLPPEVRRHEPALALFGGADGLDPLRSLIFEAAGKLAAGGALIAEFGIGQEEGIRRIVSQTRGLRVAKISRDLQGISRVVTIERSETN